MNISTIGLDLAKQTFHLIGADAKGKQGLKKCLKRHKVLAYFANLAPCLIGIEACGGAHYWARELGRLGHEVRLMHPIFVKPFLRGNKNDYNDARALCEAVVQPQMRFVSPKSEEQQDLQSLHRLRQGLIRQRTMCINQARGLLGERGVVLSRGITGFRRGVPLVLEDAENRLSERFREILADLYEQVVQLDDHIARYDRYLGTICTQNPDCKRLQEIPGVGPMIATALVAAVGDGHHFRNGRQMAAWIGLVPRQHSTGGKPVLLGISKRGDKHLRALLVHGARAVIRHVAGKEDALSCWIRSVQARRGTNVATVALANKLARMAWVVLSRGEQYQAGMRSVPA